MRWETTFIGNDVDERTSIGVKEGEVFWERSGDDDVHTNENRQPGGTLTIGEERLLDPSPLLGSYRFELGPLTTWQGRRAVEVTASRRPGTHPDALGPFSDELALVVDEERGVLLREAVVVDGEELSYSEIVWIAFDEPISPELFRPLR